MPLCSLHIQTLWIVANAAVVLPVESEVSSLCILPAVYPGAIISKLVPKISSKYSYLGTFVIKFLVSAAVVIRKILTLDSSETSSYCQISSVGEGVWPPESPLRLVLGLTSLSNPSFVAMVA